MHTLIGLMVAAAAACAIARPPSPTTVPALSQLPHRTPFQPPRRYLGNYLMPRLLLPNYFGYEDNLREDSSADEHEWLNKEIDRLSQLEDEEDTLTPFDVELSQWMSQDPYIPRPYDGPIGARDLPSFIQDSPGAEDVQVLPPRKDIILRDSMPNEPIRNAPMRHETIHHVPIQHEPMKFKLPTPIDAREKKQTFAMTPLDKGYYDPEGKVIPQQSDGPHEGGQSKTIEVSPPRQTRQNPNLGRTKNLVAENLDRLRTGLTHEASEGTDKPRHYHVLEATTDPADSIYGIALIAAVGTALTMAIFGFAFGWYTLSKKAKAAADVDYPAYGVTGPTIDTSGDRKLAHSAHMYHYQHQKQQIIAMERNGIEQRNGSVSDPESEEENEEGDYTVYECPGFATELRTSPDSHFYSVGCTYGDLSDHDTADIQQMSDELLCSTGEMEVKNPMFSEDPTPATPGKCELVKPQPKD